MVNQVLVDVENVFKWQRSADERIPSQGRIDYIQDQLRAVIWWSDEHMPPIPDVSPGWVDAIRGYGKLDPSGEAFTQVLLTWNPWLEPEVNYLEHDPQANRFTAKVDKARPFPRNRIIVRATATPEVTASFRLVGFGPNVAETVLLSDAAEELAKVPGANRLVLCSRDHLVVEFWEQHSAGSASLLLVYKDPKSRTHAGDARVATLSVLAGTYKTLNRSGRMLAPGTEISRTLFDELREATKQSRPHRGKTPAQPGPSSLPGEVQPGRVVASPVNALRGIDWEALTSAPPSATSWSLAWGSEDLHLTVASVMAAELKRIHATNDELGQCIEGLWDGAADDALNAYRAFALIALHRLSEDDGESLGAAIRSDPELHGQFWRPYVLIQPYVGTPEDGMQSAKAAETTGPVSKRRTGRLGSRPRVHAAAAALGIDSKTALELLRGVGEVVKGPATILNPPQVRKLERLVESTREADPNLA